VQRRSLAMRIIACNLVLHACTNDYTPQYSDDGAAIFQAACAECHQPLNAATPEFFFNLHRKNVNLNYVEFKVYNGGITMPKFPNIKRQKMKMLAKYVLAHNLGK
jgi:mono/diheme cytochrome c family protein